LALLIEFQKLDVEAQLLVDGLDVGHEAGQPKENAIVDLENLLAICRNGQHLHAEPSIRSNRNALIPGHGDDRGPVVRRDR
jgi:hypothetical protein